MRRLVITNIVDLCHGRQLEFRRKYGNLFFTPDVDAGRVVLEVPVLLTLGISSQHVGLDLSLVGLVGEALDEDLLSVNFIIYTVFSVSILL